MLSCCFVILVWKITGKIFKEILIFCKSVGKIPYRKTLQVNFNQNKTAAVGVDYFDPEQCVVSSLPFHRYSSC